MSKTLHAVRQNRSRAEPGAASLDFGCCCSTRLNTDFMKYDVRSLGNFLIGATNPDHTPLGKDGISSKRVNVFTVSSLAENED